MTHTHGPCSAVRASGRGRLRMADQPRRCKGRVNYWPLTFGPLFIWLRQVSVGDTTIIACHRLRRLANLLSWAASPATRASFLARVQRFTRASRRTGLREGGVFLVSWVAPILRVSETSAPCFLAPFVPLRQKHYNSHPTCLALAPSRTIHVLCSRNPMYYVPGTQGTHRNPGIPKGGAAGSTRRATKGWPSGSGSTQPLGNPDTDRFRPSHALLSFPGISSLGCSNDVPAWFSGSRSFTTSTNRVPKALSNLALPASTSANSNI